MQKDISEPAKGFKSAREWAKSYFDRGWKPIPALWQSPNPTAKGWSTREFDLEEFSAFRTKRQNICVQMGRPSHGLTDVDLDCPTARKLARYFLPPTGAIFGRASAERSHWLYYTDLWKTAKRASEKFEHPNKAKAKGENDHGACLVELRTGRVEDGEVKGVVSMFPGSKHKSGELVEWFKDGEPAPVDGDKLRSCVQELAAATLLADHYPSEGRRHDAALVLGGVLARARFPQEEIEVFVEAVAKVAGDEEWQERVNDVRNSAERWAAGEPTQGRPKLREYWGDEVGDKIADWLDLQASPASDDDDEDEEDSGHHQQKQVDVLIALASEGELFLGIDGIPHADIQRDGHRETYTIASSGFKDWLLLRYWKQVKSAPSGEAIRMALGVVGAKAKFGEGVPKREVFVRAAAHGGKCYLDLCDDEWRVVEIDAVVWRIVTDSPVRFRRAKGMKPLPTPIKGGTIETLEKYLNIRKRTDNDLILILAWLVAALHGTGPYPILKIWGEPGSAKSTMVDVLRELVDPNKSTRRQIPKEIRDFHITANNSHILSFDNVSDLKDWASDTLCVMSTGGGFATRTLYTDQDEQLFEAVRPVILNGVENFLMRFDLAERTIVLQLLPITPKKRRLEREFKAAFAADRPLILGFLLDLMAHGIRELPNMPSESWPRMADFAQWAEACLSRVFDKGAFRVAYERNRQRANRGAIEDDPVAAAICELIDDKNPEWDGTTAELLDELSRIVGEKVAKSKNWPDQPRALTGRLQKAKAALRGVGITWTCSSHTRRGAILRISYRAL